MASLMEELISTLTEEEELYRELIPVSEEKTKAIVANDFVFSSETGINSRYNSSSSVNVEISSS
ncbi:MAG: hypothetical protein J6I65_04655, partial [Lachnospiraceae bacterium]|nr:hypothetical protein [Lachnospiraceae bacterium]